MTKASGAQQDLRNDTFMTSIKSEGASYTVIGFTLLICKQVRNK